MLVHVSCSSVSVDVALVEYLHHVLCALNHKSGKVLHIHSCVFITKLKISTTSLLREQIPYGLIVYLEVRRTNQELLFGVT